MRLRPLQLGGLLLILAAAVSALVVAVEHEQDKRVADRQEWANHAAAHLTGEIEAAGAIVSSARALFSLPQAGIDAATLDHYAAVELEDSRMRSLNWAPRVLAADRAAFERELGRPIRSAGTSGPLSVAGRRPEYFPLVLWAPSTPLTRAVLGVDVATDPSLRRSLAEARDSGKPAVSDAVSLGLGGELVGVALVAAVYGGSRPASIAERRAALRGFTGGTFAIADLVAGAVEELPAGSRLQVVSAGVQVFDSGRGAAPASVSEARTASGALGARVALQKGPIATAFPILVLTGGALLLMAFVAVLFVQANQRRRESEEAGARLRHEADTDSLTGLGNRRHLRRDLTDVAEHASATEPAALVFFDLNGFKGYNDRFGHPAGDVLLARLAAKLVAAVPEGRAYRLGGDEFCVLASVGSVGLLDLVSAASAALVEHGDDFTITAAHGVALLPEDATTVDGAMAVADERMFARKAVGRQSAGRQSADVLVRATLERHPNIGVHLSGVADLADRVAAQLGLHDTERVQVVRAALLHDVGKVAIPDSILRKPGALDSAEREFIRRHTLIGERILKAAPSLEPVARLVRSSHERWDGAGYPDALAGDQIPLGSRIIFACDAFEAMTSSDRPYREPLTAGAALDELTDCAGDQFDPRVVGALAAVLRAEGLPRARRSSAARPEPG